MEKTKFIAHVTQEYLEIASIKTDTKFKVFPSQYENLLDLEVHLSKDEFREIYKLRSNQNENSQINHSYACAIAAGTLHLAKLITYSEKDNERKQKKQRVVERKSKLLKEAFPEETQALFLPEGTQKLLEYNWSWDESMTFLIDLAFTNPFAPYELEFKESDFEEALKQTAVLVGRSTQDVKRILETKKKAFNAHWQLDWGKVALFGIGGIALFGVGGWLAAPLIGTAIGTAAGLSGAAATSHGLAILGGGSLALGGAGMAGGMWLVTGVGAATGLALGGGSTMLLQLGAAGVKVELIKLQVNYKEVLLDSQMQLAKAQTIIKSLEKQHREIKQQLEEERLLNEKNSKRIKECEEIIKALEDAIEWMQKEGK